MAIEKILRTDTLNVGRTKINNAIDALANNTNTVSIGFNEFFNTLEDLKSKYPSGADGAFLVFNNGNNDGSHIYIFKNNTWTDFGIYQATAIADNSVTPQKTTFLKSLNLFDGNYLKDTSISGSEPFTFVNRTGGQTAEIRIKPNTTYYIGREVPSRFNFGTATSKKTFGNSLDGKIRQNYSGSGETSSPEIFKITTGPNDNYLYINNSNNNENKFLLVTENEINSVGNFDYNRATLDKNIEIPNIKNQKTMRVIYNGTNNLKIYIPSKKTDLSVCYEYLKVDDDASNMHQWRVQNTYIVNNDLSVKYQLDYQTEWEGAIKEVGASDYMGGQHGDERNVAISFNFDGKQYDMSQAFKLDVFNEIKIISHSILNRADHPGDDLLKRVKISTWNLNEYTVENIYTALQPFEIFESKLTLMSCRYNDNLTSDVLVNKARRDVEYTDVAISSASVGSLGSGTKDAHLIEMWGDNLYFSARCEAEYERYPNRKQLIQNFSGEAIPRAKIYFDITGNYSINKDEVLKNKSTYRLIV